MCHNIVNATTSSHSHIRIIGLLTCYLVATVNTFCFLYVCGVTRGYIDLDCALLLTNHMLNYITITLLVAIAIAIMIDLSSGLQIHRLNLSLCT